MLEDRRPFAGIRILDVTRVIASPFAAYQLAILGADVIKIEDPQSGGDTVRYRRGSKPELGARGLSTYFMSQSANKRSMTLNLRTKAGQEIFRRMAAKADVLIENLRTGTMRRYGLSYHDLCAENSRLVYCALTGYGQNGPKSRHPAYDPVIQAASGMMSTTGTPDTGPLRLGPPIADYSAGLAAAFAIATALFERERSGKGQFIDVSMLDASLVMMSAFVTEILTTGSTPTPYGNRSSVDSYTNACFACRDGLLYLCAMEPHQRRRVWQVLGRPDIPADPRFSTDEACRANIEILHEEMGKTFQSLPAQEWEDRLNEAGVPAMRVRSIPEILRHPQLRGRNLLQSVEVPAIGRKATLALAPFQLSAAAARIDSPPPLLGQHTDELLEEMGYPAERIAQLRAEGAI